MKFALTLAAIIAAAPLAALASDLSRDLKVPFAPLSNPFANAQEQGLEPTAAAELKALLENCAFTPGQFNASGAITGELETGIFPICSASLSLNADKNQLTVRTSDLFLEIVSWDGSQSDGGDEQAVGVYGFNGQRLAVYPSLFADGNVIDGIAHALAVQISVVRR
jgi:hypothetical protein